jgi:hypothetical protein
MPFVRCVYDIEGVGSAVSDTDLGGPLCRRDPSAWDVDSSTPDELRRSARDCVYRCPLYARCRAAVVVGAVTPRSMVWAGRAYDQDGDVVDLDRPGHKVGRGQGIDTRTADSAGRVYNGHTGGWEPTTPGVGRGGDSR